MSNSPMIEPAHVIDRLYGMFTQCGEICTDSRRIVGESMFFALRGDSFDGNTFVTAALGQGAKFAVTDDPQLAAQAPVALQSRIVTVHNSLTSLQQLAARHRSELGIPILAITGSNGKTTTKELTARVLAQKFKIAVTHGNLNNHIGVPLTLLGMHEETEFGIVEMGASAQGEIALLCRIAQPNFGIITNVGLAHLEGFKSSEGVRKGKGELFDYLAENGGLAFYRANDATLRQMADERAGLRSVAYEPAQGDIPNHLEGGYNLYNISAAVAIGTHFEVPHDKIISAIESYHPDNNRSQAVRTATNRLIVDCYNANPSSMAAALLSFETIPDDELPKAVIFGDMLELGQWAEGEHRRIVEMLLQSGIEKVFLVGENFSNAANSICVANMADNKTAILTFADVAQLSAYLKETPLASHFILIKGSRGIKLETMVGLL